MASLDPTGVLGALVSEAVREVIGLAKSAIHCKKKCRELEDSLTKASDLLGEMNSAAEGSLSSSQLDSWLKALQAKVEEAKPLVLECQSLQNPILDGRKRIQLATKIEHCSKAIHGHLAAASLHLGVEILKNIDTLKKHNEVPSNVVPKEEQHVVPLDKHIFGMEETLERVVSDLLESPISRKWVGVHGAGGAGKTLLAKRVCDNDQVKGRFDPVLWLTFGQSVQVEAKQDELAKKIQLEGDKISNEALRRGLVGKRCLLVLDDVWKFNDVNLFDVVQENGSKIFITTRKHDVLDSRGAIKTEMGLLGKEDSMKLFAVHAFPNQNHAQVSKAVVEQVVEKCGGLPLVLEVIGRRMAATQDWDYVLSKLKDQQVIALDEEEQVLQRLKLGYDALLPLRIQQHFLFFAAFPEDWPIRFWELFRCWKGEGLVANTAEAKNVLERLKNHALITEEGKDRPGENKRYRIHDALLALALHILEQEGPKCYFKAGQSQMRDVGDAFTSNYSRISLFECGISEIPLPKKNRVKVSSTTCLLLDYNLDLTALPSLSLFKGLKVLCLSHTEVVSLPHSIGQLKTLETLDLSWNASLKSIPDSLGNLANLSYLNLQDCPKLKSFPVDALLKLTKLVYLNGGACFTMWTCHRLHHRFLKHLKCVNRRLGRDGMFQALTELEVLIIKAHLGIGVPTISQLASLKVLNIDTCPSLKDLSISFLPKLETFTLGFCDEVTTINISECPSLRVVHIEYIHRLARVAFGGKFPRLEEIILEGLQQLSDVSLGAVDAFPQLMQLQIQGCCIDQLPEWFASLTTLRTLRLIFLGKLDVIPDGVARLPLLRRLDLQGCEKIRVLPFADSEDSSFYPSLKYLRLCNTSVSRKHLSQRLRKIAELRFLEDEDLCNNQISN
ncbi:probable disease resistance protein At1g61300 isoform X2 [Selaginella moellendorffii]|uniref:probable disease resistance protein At1g61300 isoform X2 n=1 Tax=Selaginella moellendorffii TaxID=88036 RepID=UPI000D1CBBFC|nr:probable disease resistance protein At1g61300 isoform X2 [Selaginella moellendorffii]|eukprot:XP_002979186.2 probable disease resistance protein At1g61300 isoform X2 [Selaginella moellendorffii]